ncbi:aspartyl protease family protein [Chryseobacterium echinoideorum]|uniref:aspartyl protease family protein n=1 Tax=Chryseobacterium echinoideorum TaxID=1549648 RepID=UPI0011867612|nr:retropepsin-like aspartic protease [Chryseobacterium echinoideorum]
MKKLKKHVFIITLVFFSSLLNAAEIPFELIDGKIIVPVSIKKEKHNFIFDSGAFTIISSELKNRLNEKKVNTIFEGIDANNAKSSMEVFSTNTLQLSDMNIKNVSFSFADIGWMSGRACRKISGIFGANMMKDKIWRIDFTNKKITVFEKVQLQNTNASVIPFSEENFTHVPKINAKVRNQNIEFIFDTGSGMGFSVNQKSYDLIKDDHFLTFEGLLSQSLNSISKGQRFLDMMEVEINNVKLGSHIIDSSSDAPNLIGIRFIENYLVDLDFISKKIILSSINKNPEYKSFGISLAPVENTVVIVSKLQIPELSELNLTEKIVRVNDFDVSALKENTFCELKNIMDSSETITLENASGKKFTLQKTNVLQHLY